MTLGPGYFQVQFKTRVPIVFLGMRMLCCACYVAAKQGWSPVIKLAKQPSILNGCHGISCCARWLNQPEPNMDNTEPSSPLTDVAPPSFKRNVHCPDSAGSAKGSQYGSASRSGRAVNPAFSFAARHRKHLLGRSPSMALEAGTPDLVLGGGVVRSRTPGLLMQSGGARKKRRTPTWTPTVSAIDCVFSVLAEGA